MRPILKSPRILRTGQPLTLAGIQQVCPAVFATQPHESRGPRYRYVPTIQPLEHLLGNGWGVYEASQQRARDKGRDPYTKHMLRLRRVADFNVTPGNTTAEGVPELVLINAHDGTAAYHLNAGFFRFICSNGLMVGTTVAGFTVRHTVSSQTTAEVLDAATRVVTESFPTMLENVQRFKSVVLAPEQAYRMATRAMELRYGTAAVPPFPATDLLTVRRPEDEQPTLWNVLNRVQEGAVYGGWETRSQWSGRRSAVRPVERVSVVTAINKGLWDEAAKLALELA